MSKSHIYKRPAYNNSDWKHPQQQQWNKLHSGLCGLFFTAEDEKRAFREATNLIEFVLADGEEYKEEETTKPNDGEDIADKLTKTCQGLQQRKRWNDRKYANSLQQIETGARCTLFFISPQINPENVYTLAEKMVELCKEKPQTCFLAKVIPIEETVPAYMDQILPTLSKIINKHLAKHSTQNPLSYAIDFKARNTKLLEKHKVYDDVTALMKKLVPGSTVNLTKPDMLVVVHAIRATALLGILRDFEKYQKYALRKPPIVGEQQKEREANNADKSTTNKKEKDEGEDDDR